MAIPPIAPPESFLEAFSAIEIGGEVGVAEGEDETFEVKDDETIE